ncbi:MAG: 3-hydroxylacyl-ACP dehydratase [Chromatiaceae bacterium]
MPLDRTWLLAHLPHQGPMCLLDQIAAWDTGSIRCTATSHRDQDNPLRAQGRLGAACGIEYAAQAMAAHSALLAVPGAAPRVGYLTSARGVELHVSRLDDIATDLIVEAERISGDHNTLLYGFHISAGEQLLLSGRIVVVLDVAELGKQT